MNTLTIWTFPHCPQPHHAIDWTALINQFDWLKGLADCPQDPIYHAEGDVLTHTKLVCEALISLSGWQRLSETERSILFAAALMHDVAKPQATEQIEGRITSKGHVRQGAKLARRILRSLDTPVIIREVVVSLVQLGSLPLWFWDKAEPEKSIITASYRSRCDWLALLAEADVRGRICADQARLLDAIAFFQEFAQETDCWNQPRSFASDHSRFLYFHKENRDPNYEAFDDTCCEVTLMAGLPGVGKDHWIREHLSQVPAIALDQIRTDLNVSPEESQGAVIQAAKQQAKRLLQTETSFVWNATNLSGTLRAGLIQLFANYHARVRIVYIEQPWTVILQQNQERDRAVPEVVIDRLFDRLEFPSLIEAHQVQIVASETQDPIQYRA